MENAKGRGRWKLGKKILAVVMIIPIIAMGLYATLTFIGFATPIQISCISSKDMAKLASANQLQSAILTSAKERTHHQVVYRSTYYSSNAGKPPDNEGVCTDLFWRALDGAKIDFPTKINQDIRKTPLSYPGITKPDVFIDYRRVPNIQIYLEKYAQTLPTKITPCDVKSLQNWQPGDIVIFKSNKNGIADHIAIISDKRDILGIPYLIHNYGVGEVEHPGAPWFPYAVGHYRLQEI